MTSSDAAMARSCRSKFSLPLTLQRRAISASCRHNCNNLAISTCCFPLILQAVRAM
eukprot:CAMPEP_0117516726 /NCGR_PEP_ID=MMETSP0784-20121206/31243_1 /TAXON_ID=39447 /ORGANISM="" /LENGTH=55 /DNA_ID=CAMNT_0005312581 /DNA_START=746 /DNA_END=910 /DNA_ORIENTATION=-